MKKALWFLSGFSGAVAILNNTATAYAIMICIVTIIVEVLVDEK